LAELSIKTSQKLEGTPCKWCSTLNEKKIEVYKEERFQCVEIDAGHLGAFRKYLSMNVESGWNRKQYPYIPTGNATLNHSRREGGNWVSEEFHEECGVSLVFSSGKPRIVTLYSGFNTETLSPLHRSLYSTLQRKGWLLVGEPTHEHVTGLNGNGPFISIDYKAATDNIKAEYVRTCIDVLKEKAHSMSPEEQLCLDVLGALRFEKGGPCATRGQPMGSVMSFPILCLINKTVVDMALHEMCLQGEISFKEWTSHRCLINGDDLLFKEPLPSGVGLYRRVLKHGREVGLVVNEEKTMQSDTEGEINSTLFTACIKQKKTNCAALFMRDSVADVIGEASKAARTPSGFIRMVRRNLEPLRRQTIKIQSSLPAPLWRRILKDKKIVSALMEYPEFSRERQDVNPFPVVSKPIDYLMTPGEERTIIRDKVQRMRASGYVKAKPDSPAIRRFEERKLCIALRSKKNRPEEEKILKLLQRAWEEKVKWEMVESCGLAPTRYPEYPLGGYECSNTIDMLVAQIRGHPRRPPGPVEDPLPLDADFVRL